MAATITGVFNLIDRASGPLRKIEEQAKKTDAALAMLGDRMDNVGTNKQMKQFQDVGKSLKDIERQTKGNNSSMSTMDRNTRTLGNSTDKLNTKLVRTGLKLKALQMLFTSFKIPVMVAAVGSLVQMISALGGGITAMLPQLGQWAGSVVSLLPNLGRLANLSAVAIPSIIGLGSAFLGAKLAFSGFSDAVSQGGAALDKLEPQARRVALTLRGVGKELKENLQATAQSSFFNMLTADRLKQTVFSKNAQQKATKIVGVGATTAGAAADNVLTGLTSGGFMGDFLKIARSMQPVVVQLSSVFLDLAHAAMDVGIAARPMTKWLGDTIKGWSGYWRELAQAGRETGKLEDRFTEAMVVAEQFGRITRDLWNVLKDVFMASDKAGKSLWDSAEKGVKSWADWTSSFEGQNRMETWFNHARKSASTVWSVLKNVGRAMLAIGGASRETGDTLWKSLDKTTEKWAEWTESIAGKNEMKEYFADVREPLQVAGELVSGLAAAFVGLGRSKAVTATLKVLKEGIAPLAQSLDNLGTAFGPVLANSLVQIITLFTHLQASGSAFASVVALFNSFLEIVNKILDKVGLLSTAFSVAVFGFAIQKAWAGVMKLASAWGLVAKSAMTAAAAQAIASNPGGAILPAPGGRTQYAGPPGAVPARPIPNFYDNRPIEGPLTKGATSVPGNGLKSNLTQKVFPKVGGLSGMAGLAAAGGLASKAAGAVGKFLWPVAALMGITQALSTPGNVLDKAKGGISGATFGLVDHPVGAGIGGAIGAGLGSIVPGAGTMTGGMIGMALGEVLQEPLVKAFEGVFGGVEETAKNVAITAARQSEARLGRRAEKADKMFGALNLNEHQVKQARKTETDAAARVRRAEKHLMDMREKAGKNSQKAFQAEQNLSQARRQAAAAADRLNTVDRLTGPIRGATKNVVAGQVGAAKQNLQSQQQVLDNQTWKFNEKNPNNILNLPWKQQQHAYNIWLAQQEKVDASKLALQKIILKANKQIGGKYAHWLQTTGASELLGGRPPTLPGLPGRPGRGHPRRQPANPLDLGTDWGLKNQDLYGGPMNPHLSPGQPGYNQQGPLKGPKLPPITVTIDKDAAKKVKEDMSHVQKTAGKVNDDIEQANKKSWRRNRENMTSQIDKANQELKPGFRRIHDTTLNALVNIGFSDRRANKEISGATGMRVNYASGGRIPGMGMSDNVKVGPGHMAAPGELIVNRHTEADVNRDLVSHGKAPLGRRVAGESRKHSYPASSVYRPRTPERKGAEGMRMFALGGIVAAGNLAQRMGLSVGENPAFGGVTPVHVGGSYHYSGDAVDVSGSAALMDRYFHAVEHKWAGSGLAELFYDPEGYYYKHDQKVMGAIGNHSDHVHAAITSGAAGRRGMGGMGIGGPGAGQSIKVKRPKTDLPGIGGVFSQKAMNIVAAALQKKLNKRLGGGGGIVGGGGGGGSVPAQIYNVLAANGLNKIGAAGIIGNAYAESSFDPAAQGYGGGGLWGFTASPNSLADLQSYASGKGKPWTSAALQTRFLLEHVAGSTISGVNRAGSPEAAAEVFMTEFERPGIPRLDVRQEAARRAFNQGYATGGRVPGFGGWFGNGGSFTATGPTMIGVGENGSEHVQITPKGKSIGGTNVTIQAINIENHRKGDVKKAVKKEIEAAFTELERELHNNTGSGMV